MQHQQFSCFNAVLRLLLPCFVSVLSACTSTPTAFRLYYGAEASVLQQMANADEPAVLVADARALPETQRKHWLKNARKRHHLSLAYLSIGELDQRDLARAESQFPTIRSAFLEYNDKFNSWRVDVSQPIWQDWINHELHHLANAGYTGFFLDTPDTVDRYITHPQWTRTQRGERVQAMVRLIRHVKQRYPRHFVLLNRGLNLVSHSVWMDEKGLDLENGLALAQGHPDNPDALLYENAFASRDEWTLRIEADLQAIAQAGYSQIFALGYRDTISNARCFFDLANQHAFVAAWANSSTDLHLYATQTETEWLQQHSEITTCPDTTSSN